MGKNRHSKDRLFVTQTEHKYLYGGKKTEIKRAYRRLPYDCCAITLTPFSNPVATREGHVFDLVAIVPFVKEHQINPVTGAPLALKELVQLKFSKNSDGAYFCPVTYKVFTDNSKIAAIATTGNVFAYDAIDELNIKPKNWTDLLTGESFKRKDIIILQDPEDLSSREIENFEHLRRAKSKDEPTSTSEAAKNIRTNAATDRILKELEAKKAKQRELAEKIQRGDDEGVSEREKIIAKLTHGKPPISASSGSSAAPGSIAYSKFTTGAVSRSFTSSAMAPITEHGNMAATETEVLEERWRVIRKMKKKGLVRLETTLGDLHVQIDCDFVPQTADNFVSLCATQYYDGVLFHRIIKGFMMQGGDPTGTGRGGQSIWKKAFRDEMDSRLSHDARGVLSMANSGPGTNKSQFFITFKATPHLDKKHAVFGRVVGDASMSVLDAFEQLATGDADRPYDDVKIIKAHVLENPFQDYEDALAKGTDVFTVEKQKLQESQRVKGTVVKVGNEWVAYDDLEGVDIAKFQKQQGTDTSNESVGKYLKAATSSKKRSLAETEDAPQKPVVAVPMAIDSKKSKQAKPSAGGFGDFSGWSICSPKSGSTHSIEKLRLSVAWHQETAGVMEKYVVEKVVGEGTYGIVYRATEKGTNDHVAIKKFKTVGDEQLSKREIQACSMLSHAYIVSYRHSFRHEGLLHLVFDHVPDSMNKLLNRNRRGVKPALAQRLIYQLCQALQYCHASHIIHRDIKPDNILIDENGDIRVCDFGVARTIQFEGDPLSDYVATRWYRPPEQELRMDRYSFDADIWSVGCVLMELLTGRPLFPGNTQIDQLNLIQEHLGALPPTLATRLPRGVATVKTPTKSFQELLGDRVLPEGTLDFLMQTIQLEPKLRLSAAGCLAHPFLKPLKDAEQRERKTRQLEEKQRRSRNAAMGSPDSEDGIEEEIPGGSRAAEAKSPGPTPMYRGGAAVKPFDFNSGGSKETRTSTPQSKNLHREAKNKSESKSKHGRFAIDTENQADGDSDYIQEEIIEMDEMSLAEPVSPRGRGRGKRTLGDDEAEDDGEAGDPPVRSPSKTKAAGRRRRQAKDEPVGAHDHECYEDDFED